MNISENKNNALITIKENNSVLFCTFNFICITIIVSSINRYVSQLVAYSLVGNKAYIPVDFFTDMFFYIMDYQLGTSFIYMIINKKTKFKRHFSFLHTKYLKFFLLYATVFYLTGKVFEMLSIKCTGKLVGIFPVALSAVISLFQLCVIYFKAKQPCRDFTYILKNSLSFLKNNIKNVFIFHLSFFPFEIIRLIVLDIFFVKLYIDVNGLLGITLLNSYSGLGIFVFPYYLLSFHYMVNNLT